MERPRYVFIGGLIVAAVIAFAAVFDLGGLSGVPSLVWIGLLVLGGVSILVGGWQDAITIGSRRLAWWRFVGFGNALVGLALVTAYLPDLLAMESTTRIVLAVVAVVGGGAVFAVGVDTALGGKLAGLRRS